MDRKLNFSEENTFENMMSLKLERIDTGENYNTRHKGNQITRTKTGE